MRRSQAVLSLFIAGLLCLTLAGAGVAATKDALSKNLIEAVWKNDLPAVQRLVGEGADPNATDEKGFSAVDIAVDKGFFDIAIICWPPRTSIIRHPQNPRR
ncbi:MAG: ankyrin repeat domain-containing protein [Rhodospirillales bacterium]|nr:ankyrin repeat domain-containing protein [Rhodospirillales bacterium]